VSALADDQSTILRTVGQKVDKALEAAEARLLRILILVGPWLVRLEIFAVGEGDVDGVKADDEVLSVVDLLESANDTRLLANIPGPRLVRGTWKDVSRTLVLSDPCNLPYPKIMPFSLMTGR
jgi:hypothetical protein